MRTLVVFTFGAAVLVAASCGARTPFDESEVAGTGGATSGGPTGTGVAATTSGSGTGDTVGAGTSGTATGDTVATTTTGPIAGSTSATSSTFVATTGGGTPGTGGAFGAGGAPGKGGAGGVGASGVSTSTGAGGVSTSTGAGGVFTTTTGFGTGGPAGAAGRGGTGGFGGFAGGFGRDGGVVVDAGRADASGANPLLGILPGVQPTPQCNRCVDTRCTGSSACSSDPACLGGVACYFGACLTLTNQGQQIACALKCFNGNIGLAMQASNAVTCVYGACGPSCVGGRAGGRGAGGGG